MHPSLILCFGCIDLCLVLVATSQSRYALYCFPYARPPSRLSSCRLPRQSSATTHDIQPPSSATPHDVNESQPYSATVVRYSAGVAFTLTTSGGIQPGSLKPSVIRVMCRSRSQIQSQTHHRGPSDHGIARGMACVCVIALVVGRVFRLNKCMLDTGRSIPVEIYIVLFPIRPSAISPVIMSSTATNTATVECNAPRCQRIATIQCHGCKVFGWCRLHINYILSLIHIRRCRRRG